MLRNILRLIHKKVGHYHATNACEHMCTVKRQDVEQKIIKTNKGGRTRWNLLYFYSVQRFLIMRWSKHEDELHEVLINNYFQLFIAKADILYINLDHWLALIWSSFPKSLMYALEYITYNYIQSDFGITAKKVNTSTMKVKV